MDRRRCFVGLFCHVVAAFLVVSGPVAFAQNGKERHGEPAGKWAHHPGRSSISQLVTHNKRFSHQAVEQPPLDFSTERVFTRSTSNGLRELVTLRAENDSWILEGFRIASDGWQDRIWTRSYRSQDQAAETLRQLNFRAIQEFSFPRAQFESNGRELFSSKIGSSLWIVKGTWSWHWEEKFAEWVRDHTDPEFFNRYKIATDCADVAYALRWIFARINGLPAAARLAGTGNLLTQDSVRAEWQSLPSAANWWEDRRFMRALDYLMDNTYTHTLLGDSYPIAISTRSLLPGSYFLELHLQSGHTQFVHRTNYLDQAALPLKLMASTVPRTPRSLYETDFWQDQQPKVTTGGFLRFRWAVRSVSGTGLVAKEKMPFYSLEQYAPEFIKDRATFALAVLLSLNPAFSFEEWLLAGLNEMKKQIERRVEAVVLGFQECQRMSCLPGTPGHEAWSTPSRDSRITELLEQINRVVNSSEGGQLQPKWNKALSEPALTLNGATYSLGMVKFIWLNRLYHSEPTVSIARRWGFESEAFLANMKERIEIALEERTQKIGTQGSACNGGKCAPGSAEWEKWNTFAVDESLSTLLAADRDYCREMAVADCSTYERLRSLEDVNLRGQKKPLVEWLRDIIWLNSDPTQSATIRWGAWKQSYRWKMIPKGTSLGVGKSGWSLSSKGLLFNVESGESISPSNLFKWVALDAQGAHAIAIESGAGGAALEVIDLATRRINRLGVSGKGGVLFGSRGAFFAIDTDASIVRWIEPTSSPTASLRVSWELSDLERVFPMKSEMDNAALALSPRGEGRLLDMLGRRVIDLGAASQGARLLRLKMQTRDHWLVESCSHGPCKVIAVEKLSGVARERPDLMGLELIAEKTQNALLTRSDNSRLSIAVLAQLGPDLAIQSAQEVGLFWKIQEPLACAFSLSQGQHPGQHPGQFKTRCFSLTNGSLDESPVFPNLQISDWDREFVVWKSGDGQAVSRLADVGRIVATSWGMFSFGTAEPGWFAVAEGGLRTLDLYEPSRGSVLTTVGYRYFLTDFSTSDVSALSLERGSILPLISGDRLWIERR
jgi:hypothetical protein